MWEQSARHMTKLFPNIKVLTEQEATLPAVLSHLPNRDLVHFFCHAIFKPHDLHQSGLLLYDGLLPAYRIAYEFDFSYTAEGCDHSPWVISDTVDLNQAITCFNGQTGGSATIQFAQGFVLSEDTITNT